MTSQAAGPTRHDAATHGDDPRRVLGEAQIQHPPVETIVRKALAAAVLAPSIHNTQPWLFRRRMEPAGIELWADHSRKLHVADPRSRQLTISCGSALANLSIQLHACGVRTLTQLCPSPGASAHLATVTFPTAAARADEDGDAVLAPEIPRRFTARSAFGDASVPLPMLQRMREVAAQCGVELSVQQDRAEDVAAITRSAHRRQQIDVELQRELLAWTRPAGATATDGVVFEAFGRDSTVNRAMDFPQRDFALNRPTFGHDTLQADDDVTLVVIATDGDERRDWLTAGMGLERALLVAAADGFMASYLNQSIEVGSLRVKLKKALGLEGCPQLVLRLGIPDESRTPISPRRALRDVYRG